MNNLEDRASTAINRLADHWRSKANSIWQQIERFEVCPEVPKREAKTLELCAKQLEAITKTSVCDAVMHIIDDEMISKISHY